MATDLVAQREADAARLATVASLRERLARLGGLAGAAAVPRPKPSPAQRTEPPIPRQPGFEPEPCGAGTAWVRRLDVDLSPLLAAAGAPGAAGAGQLLRLVRGRRTADASDEPDPAAPLAVLDIESLGLHGSGVLAFLVGIGRQRGTNLELHQLLLADPGDEAALLRATIDRLAGCAALLTYNGRTFDIPALRARFIVNRLEPAGLDVAPHCDLLGPVRRLFRERLGACTLRRAEVELLAMERVDDVPGSEAPARYRAWLRGAGPEVLDGVVRHNQLDVCATAVLGARLVAHAQGCMVEPVYAADRFRLALHMERQAHADTAELLLRETIATRAAPWERRAAHRLAHRLRRGGGAGGEDEALALLRSLWGSDPSDLSGARAFAVALERAGQLSEALDVSERTLSLCVAIPRWRLDSLRNAPAGGWLAHWEHRTERLRRRTTRKYRPRAARTRGQPELLLTTG